MFFNCPVYSRLWELGSHSMPIVILLSSAFPWAAPQCSGWDPTGSARSILILLLWWGALPARLGSESTLVWWFGCPVHPELQTSPCRATKMLSSSRCPTKTRVCVPVRHLRLWLCGGLKKHPNTRHRAWGSAKTVSFVPPTACKMLPISMQLMWIPVVWKYRGVSAVQKERVLSTSYFSFVILIDKCLWQSFLHVNQCFVWTWLVESLPWNKLGANPVWLPCSKQSHLLQVAHNPFGFWTPELQGWYSIISMWMLS